MLGFSGRVEGHDVAALRDVPREQPASRRHRRRGRQPAGRPMHILFCNWRDTSNPEGGGSERYVENMARGLVERGHRVTIACAAHDGAPRDEVVDGVRFVRRGTKLDIYVRTFLALLLGRYGKVDVVVDVQNGLPFFTRLATRKPVVVLVHHVHREQWPVVYPGLVGRIGWWIESRRRPAAVPPQSVRRGVAGDAPRARRARRRPRAHHRRPQRQRPAPGRRRRRARPRPASASWPAGAAQAGRARDRRRRAMRSDHPDVVLDIVGDRLVGGELRAYAARPRRRGPRRVPRPRRRPAQARAARRRRGSWRCRRSRRAGAWSIGEAGAHGTPTVAYSTAGGTTESIDHKDSGVLVDTPDELVAALRELIEDREWREFLGQGALAKSKTFTWQGSQADFAAILETSGR